MNLGMSVGYSLFPRKRPPGYAPFGQSQAKPGGRDPRTEAVAPCSSQGQALGPRFPHGTSSWAEGARDDKRQLLNALRIVVLYNRLRDNPGLEIPPRTFFFAGKVAPAYQLAKLIIKFINNLAGTVDGDPMTRSRLKVVFLPDYCVSLAERLIPAADVSNQISIAGYEASGTSNMKFMMNGALTIGTRDGATIEMAEEASEENFFLFGLTADQVESSRGWYNPHWHYDHEPETRATSDLIFSDYFSRREPGIFAPLRAALFNQRGYYMNLADLKSYLEADQRLTQLYADGDAWARKAILNVAASGKFSSDRTIAQYATEIWNAKPCPVS
jgi:glycogen phosphorylase